jgi:hypothetical protein
MGNSEWKGRGGKGEGTKTLVALGRTTRGLKQSFSIKMYNFYDI